MNGNNVQMSDLPEFTIAKWQDTFLPTLYDKFFASEKPFDDFYNGSDQFIALLQNIIEEVYPNIDYTLKCSQIDSSAHRHPEGREFRQGLALMVPTC